VFTARYAQSPCITRIRLDFRRKNVRIVIGEEYERRWMGTVVACFTGGYYQTNIAVKRVHLRCICASAGVQTSASIMTASTSPSKGSYVSPVHVPYLSSFTTLRTPNSALGRWQRCRIKRSCNTARVCVSVSLGQPCTFRKYIEIGTWHLGTHFGYLATPTGSGCSPICEVQPSTLLTGLQNKQVSIEQHRTTGY
jgi:hypothetical protein